MGNSLAKFRKKLRKGSRRVAATSTSTSTSKPLPDHAIAEGSIPWTPPPVPPPASSSAVLSWEGLGGSGSGVGGVGLGLGLGHDLIAWDPTNGSFTRMSRTSFADAQKRQTIEQQYQQQQGGSLLSPGSALPGGVRDGAAGVGAYGTDDTPGTSGTWAQNGDPRTGPPPPPSLYPPSHNLPPHPHALFLPPPPPPPLPPPPLPPPPPPSSSSFNDTLSDLPPTIPLSKVSTSSPRARAISRPAPLETSYGNSNNNINNSSNGNNNNNSSGLRLARASPSPLGMGVNGGVGNNEGGNHNQQQAQQPQQQQQQQQQLQSRSPHSPQSRHTSPPSRSRSPHSALGGSPPASPKSPKSPTTTTAATTTNANAMRGGNNTNTNNAQTNTNTVAHANPASFPLMPRRWKKGDLLGSGSFGNVYLGLNIDTGGLVAVKEVNMGPEGLPIKESEAQLEQEVQLLSSLQHPNIVRYLGTAHEGDFLYIFLEYVPGGSIQSLLQRFGPFDEALVRVYTRQLLEGLSYLHASRTVHRDIKGANILVEKSGRIKLADFGMAKQFVEQSMARSFKGSAYWMAPEHVCPSPPTPHPHPPQVIRQRGHGVAADVWSVGCTVLEMATGRPPWSQCSTQVQAIFKIASSAELPKIPEHLSPEASEFILLCLQRNPLARPSSEKLLQHPFVANAPVDVSAIRQAVASMTDSISLPGMVKFEPPRAPSQGKIQTQQQQQQPLIRRRTIDQAEANNNNNNKSPVSDATSNDDSQSSRSPGHRRSISEEHRPHANGNAVDSPGGGGKLRAATDTAAMMMSQGGGGGQVLASSSLHASMAGGNDNSDEEELGTPQKFRVRGLLGLPPLKFQNGSIQYKHPAGGLGPRSALLRAALSPAVPSSPSTTTIDSSSHLTQPTATGQSPLLVASSDAPSTPSGFVT
eukprot:jgi/Chlat1/7041/Chrsp56S06667